MKTVEEIKEEIAKNAREFKELDNINTFTGGMTIGWLNALKWVLEDSEDVEND